MRYRPYGRRGELASTTRRSTWSPRVRGSIETTRWRSPGSPVSGSWFERSVRRLGPDSRIGAVRRFLGARDPVLLPRTHPRPARGVLPIVRGSLDLGRGRVPRLSGVRVPGRSLRRDHVPDRDLGGDSPAAAFRVPSASRHFDRSTARAREPDRTSRSRSAGSRAPARPRSPDPDRASPRGSHRGRRRPNRRLDRRCLARTKHPRARRPGGRQPRLRRADRVRRPGRRSPDPKTPIRLRQRSKRNAKLKRENPKAYFRIDYNNREISK